MTVFRLCSEGVGQWIKKTIHSMLAINNYVSFLFRMLLSVTCLQCTKDYHLTTWKYL
jgi:hypothetical protein